MTDETKAGRFFEYYQVVPLYTAGIDRDIFEWFQEHINELDSMTGDFLQVSLPESVFDGDADDVYDAFMEKTDADGKSRQRYPGLKRQDLPCLWFESPKGKRFWRRLPANRDDLGPWFRKLCDAAADSWNIDELREKFPEGEGLDVGPRSDQVGQPPAAAGKEVPHRPNTLSRRELVIVVFGVVGLGAVLAYPMIFGRIFGEHRPPLEPQPPKRVILFLAANPTSTEQLDLVGEFKRIQGAIERSRKREQFLLVQVWATTDVDLRRALLDSQPEIVHFSGHGAGNGPPGSRGVVYPGKDGPQEGLFFEDAGGQPRLIPGKALAGLFQPFAPQLKCVLLNACYSEIQAKAIGQHIDYVIGMKKAIGDKAAIKFAEGFYDALGAGRDYKEAFELGGNAIAYEHIPEQLTPVCTGKLRQQSPQSDQVSPP
jgi:hypothetical protein